MTKNNTVEKIDDIISKINDSEELSDKEARKLLRVIDEDLEAIEKEEKHKEIVEKKVKEFREEINKSLSKSLGWGLIKTFLNDDVKDDLEELKNEIVKLEKLEEEAQRVSIPTPIILEYKVEDSEELARWRKVFPGQTPEEASEILKKMLQGLIDYKNHSDEFQNQIKEIKEKSNSSPDFLEFGDRLTQRSMEMAQLGSKIGDDVMPLVGHAVGTWIGTAAGVTTSLLGGGGYFVDKNINTAKELAEKTGDNLTDIAKKLSDNTTRTAEKISDNVTEVTTNVVKEGAGLFKEGINYFNKTREDAKEFTENLVSTGAKVTETFVGAGENLAKEAMGDVTKVVEKNLEVWEEAVKSGVGMKAGIVSVGVGMGTEAAVKKELEMSKEKIVDLEKEITELKMKNKELQKQIEKQSDKTQDNLMNVIEIMAKSAANSRVPSPAPPYPGEKL